MQGILTSSLGNQLRFGFKRVSEHKAALRRHRYYETLPHLYKRVSDIAKKIDFKSPDTKFPVNVSLKYRWIYRPDKYLQDKLKQHDFIDFKDMTGNQLLLQLENAQHMRISELVNALGEIAKRDPGHLLNLQQHPWVLKAIERVPTEIMHMNQRQVTYLMMTYYRLGVVDAKEWEMFENISKKFLNKILAKGFGNIFSLAFIDDGQRSSKEFRLFGDLQQLIGRIYHFYYRFIYAMKQIYDQGLMTDHLFENHFHQILWKRTEWLNLHGQIPNVFSVLRDMKYENDEFLYPDVYRKLTAVYMQVPVRHLRGTQQALQDTLKAFPSHNQYKVGELIQKIEERIKWEESTGQPAKQISLVSMVQKDLQEFSLTM